MIKNSPIRKPYFYDTKEGIDHFTKLMVEDNPKKLTPKELADINKLNKDMKKSVLNHHIKTLKPFDNQDPSTYPSRPEVRGKLREIEKLEKDLKLVDLPIVKDNINNIKPRSRTGNPSGRDYWKETVALNVGNKGPTKLPEMSPEDRNQPRLWEDVIYKSMTPFERGTWNAQQRNKKLEQKKEEEKERLSSNQMAKEVVGHINQKIDIPHIVNIHDTPPTTEVMPPPIFERRQERGLHEGFVKEKQYEAKLMAKIDKELERDEQV